MKTRHFFIFAVALLVSMNLMATVDITGYQWDEGEPQVLRTSQVYGGSGESRQACGAENFEVCVGTATKDGDTKLIKCYIPKNSTICPTSISANEQCMVANEATPENAGVIPACRRGVQASSRGCHCGRYIWNGETLVKRNREECVTLMRQREAYRCSRTPTASGCPGDTSGLGHCEFAEHVSERCLCGNARVVTEAQQPCRESSTSTSIVDQTCPEDQVATDACSCPGANNGLGASITAGTFCPAMPVSANDTVCEEGETAGEQGCNCVVNSTQLMPGTVCQRLDSTDTSTSTAVTSLDEDDDDEGTSPIPAPFVVTIPANDDASVTAVCAGLNCTALDGTFGFDAPYGQTFRPNGANGFVPEF